MLPQLKQVVAINATSLTNGATGSGIIDTLGADYATIDIVATTQAATNGNPTVLKLQEADVTNATSFADIVGFRGGTDFTIPNGSTSAANGYKFNVDCRPRKRYLQVVISPVTTQTVTAVANLARNEQSPVTAAKAGVLALVEG